MRRFLPPLLAVLVLAAPAAGAPLDREIRLNYPDRIGAMAAVAVAPEPETEADADADAGDAVSEYVRQVQTQLDAVREQDLEGYEPVLGPEIDVLELEDSVAYDLPVERDTEYMIIGVCDADCDDLDLAVYDQDGNQITSDFATDDYPVLEFRARRRGTWTLQVSMPGCAADTCVFGVEVYAR